MDACRAAEGADDRSGGLRGLEHVARERDRCGCDSRHGSKGESDHTNSIGVTKAPGDSRNESIDITLQETK
jgi:hypothetical protein